MLSRALTSSQVAPLWEGQRAWKDRNAKIDPSNDAPVPFSASWPNWFGYFGVRLRSSGQAGKRMFQKL